MATNEWKTKWQYEVRRAPGRTGVYHLRGGGFLVQARSTDPRTGKRKFALRILRDATLPEAQAARDALQSAIALGPSKKKEKQRFDSFAASLFRRKVAAGDLKSEASVVRWKGALIGHLVPQFGAMWCDEIRYSDIKVDWLDEKIAPVVASGDYSPRTANGWLAIMRVICNAMTSELELARNPCVGVRGFDLSTNPTYTDEEPNAVTPDQARAFLAEAKRSYPRHYAMMIIGFVTGLRPSTLRPLRKSGPTPDVLWEEGAILARRSHTRGTRIMEKTKGGKNQRVSLPAGVMDILRWHVAQMNKAEAKSELLFPSEKGELRSRTSLDHPFKRVREAIKLPIHVTPRAMRRTFQDLGRAAGVEGIVARAISGHQTLTMQEHYSTVQRDEMRGAIKKVHGLIGKQKTKPRKAVRKAVKGRAKR